MEKITRDKWIWFGHAAHFICAKDCKFFMATKVGKYIISTVGEYLPDYRIQKIYADSRGIEIKGIGDEWDRNYLQKIGYEDLSYDGWKYETMVFKAIRNPYGKKDKSYRICCPYVIASGFNLDQNRYKEADEAYKGHYKMCDKWSKK